MMMSMMMHACPTYREVLQAVSVISRHIESVDNAFSRKLEAILASFRHQMRLEASRNMTCTPRIASLPM